MIVNVETDGTITFVWNDALASLRDEGTTTIRRASHVEPTPDGQWTADMSPVNGPTLGPFTLRQEALDAEVEWLRIHLLKEPCPRT